MSDTFAQGYALIVGVGADLPDTGEQATVANIRAVLETLAPGDTVVRLSNLMNWPG